MTSIASEVATRDANEAQAPSAKRPESKLRLHLLDAIRGWAAVQVLFFHICHEMFARKVPELGAPTLNFIFNGAFAVAIFFVLSGEVLSHAYFVRNDIGPVRKLAIKRYVRLVIPIFASCFIVFLLMKANLIFAPEANAILDRPDWLGKFLPFEASVPSFLSYVLFNVFADQKPTISYNPFLWSMSVELIGSIFVFLTLFITRTRGQRLAVYAFTAPFLLVYNPFLICFSLGMMIGEMRVAGLFDRLSAHPAANFVAVFVLLDVALGLTVYPMLPIPQIAVAQRLSFAAAIFLFAIYSSNWLQSLFDNRLSHLLGEMSFPIYLVHFPIIVSLQSFLVLRMFSDGVVTRPGAYLIMAATIVVSLAAAYAFRYVERFAINFSNAFFAFVDRL